MIKIRISLYMMICLFCFPLIAFGVCATEEELLPRQSFEAGAIGDAPEGWTEVSGDRKGPEPQWQITDTGANGTARAIKTLSRQEGDSFLFRTYPEQKKAHRIEFWTRTPPAADRSGLVFGLSQGSPENPMRRAVHLVFGRGALMFTDGIALRPISGYKTDTWYKITLVIDPALGAYTISLNDESPLPGLLPFTNSLSSVDTLYFNNRAIGLDQTVLLVDEIRVTASSAPSTPADLRVSPPSPSSIHLTWSPGPGSQPTGYHIYRAGQLLARVPGEAAGYTDTGLGAGTGYGYAVTALDDSFPPRESLPTWPVAALTPLAGADTTPRRNRYDLIVVGGTSGGIGAALAAARLGSSVAIVERSDRIGGMMSGGLGRTDYGTKASAGGIFKEFADRVVRYYSTTFGPDSRYVRETNGGYYFEPKVALGILTRMIRENPKIEIYYRAQLEKLSLRRGRVTGIEVSTPEGNKRLRAPLFVDATYEGDLAAMAGAPYRVGRESRWEFNEEHAGEIFTDMRGRKLIFGSGAGDKKVQAYNFRFTLTNRPTNRVPIPHPERYDRSRYLGVLKALEQGHIGRMTDILSMLYDLLPNDKFDANNMPGPFPSTDLLGGSDAYPEADWKTREQIIREHRDYTLGLLYFCQNDPELSEEFRADARQWGFPKDEFEDYEHFPPQIYVREARRIEGDYLFTENDARQAPGIERAPVHPGSVAVADYPLDSHATSPLDLENPFLHEGYFFLGGGITRPSQLPYGILLPKGVENVMTCIAVSTTHIGYGTLRLEPCYIAMGQAVGTAAHLSRKYRSNPRRVPIDLLQSTLLAQGQVLSVFNDVDQKTKGFDALQYLGTRGFFDTYQALPEQEADRAAVARWLYRMVRLARSDTAPQTWDWPRFADVPSDHPDRAAIETLYRMEIMDTRTSYFHFEPDRPVTRAEFARWLVRACQAIRPWPESAPEAPHYLDVASDHPDYNAIETLYRHGIRSDGWANTPAWGGGLYFLPSSPLQRAEVCQALYHLILKEGLFKKK